MCITNLTEILNAREEGREASPEAARWGVDSLVVWLDGDSIEAATGLSGASRRRYWLDIRDSAIIDAWLLVCQRSALSNREAAFEVFRLVSDQPANLDCRLAGYIGTILDAGEKCGHLGSGEAYYNKVWETVKN